MGTPVNTMNPNVHPALTRLKTEALGAWLAETWQAERADWLVMLVNNAVVHQRAMRLWKPSRRLPGGYCFVGASPVACPVTPTIYAQPGDEGLNLVTGGFLYRFAPRETGAALEVLLAAAYTEEEYHTVTALACLPPDFLPVWQAFEKGCSKLAHGLSVREDVRIIGGRARSFAPTVDWDDIVLPEALKADLFHDVHGFFRKGVPIYQRLKLKPFRKLLLAGVPGTGKTMLCAALAKWAIKQRYLVIYVSTMDGDGAQFWKIERALQIASDSKLPTLILLEELDAYLTKPDEKSMVLNVLDGSEATANEKGVLLIATTNYPAAIDERILKRPGRMDRVFIIPEADAASADTLLRHYLGEVWQAEHAALVPHLTGYPGAFIREVALHALTQIAHREQTHLPLEVLEESFRRLKQQIAARDDFLTRRGTLGFVPASNGQHA
ncbi:MAG: ATP-binding protein [Anaerolineae bacterium]|nr:ATP-binding protein [Anaerolineae bacterium]